MKFPILIKNKTTFIWYGNHWMNIKLEIMIHGGGLKGFFRFAYRWIQCVFGKHRVIGHAGFKNAEDNNLKFMSWKQCAYCHKKENKDE